MKRFLNHVKKIGSDLKKNAKIIAVAVTMMILTMVASANTGGGSTGSIDLTGVNLMEIFSEVKAMIPQVLPVILAFIGLRKALGFLMRGLRGA